MRNVGSQQSSCVKQQTASLSWRSWAIAQLLTKTGIFPMMYGHPMKPFTYKCRVINFGQLAPEKMMSDLIQKAIDQTERSQFGLCCAEAVHALDIANERIEELKELLELWVLYYTDGLPDDELRDLHCGSVAAIAGEDDV
jgi:hypothetical protein